MMFLGVGNSSIAWRYLPLEGIINALSLVWNGGHNFIVSPGVAVP